MPNTNDVPVSQLELTSQAAVISYDTQGPKNDVVDTDTAESGKSRSALRIAAILVALSVRKACCSPLTL